MDAKFPELLTPGDVASWLHTTSNFVLRQVKQGTIPHIVLPNGDILFERDDLIEWVRSYLIPSGERAPFVGVWRAPGALRFLQLSPWRSLSQAVSFVVWFTSPLSSPSPRLSQAVSLLV
jgi:hypothetical protein